ncbi:hypothetical protein Q1695_015741 [Nippostrongylus brasiliensis]|nr:hypothetical protein Q1695_015741 [Nippostrongylus brasiliensis]
MLEKTILHKIRKPYKDKAWRRKMAKFSTLIFELIFSLALLSEVRGIDYFTTFCQNGLFGSQGYVQVYSRDHANRCVMRFPIYSKDRAMAEDICRQNSPYRLYTANYGDTTECYYDWPTQSCPANELALFNNCYEVRGFGQYQQYSTACGGSVKPHSVGSQLEASWLAYFLGEKNAEVWVANGDADDQYEEIKPIKQKMKGKFLRKYGKHNGPAPVKLRMKQMSDGMQRGQAIFAHPKESHSFLCSKSGVYLK